MATVKHRTFVLEPMGDKLVTKLAGVGPAIGNRLNENGYDKVDFLINFYTIKKLNQLISCPSFKAYVVLGQFLVLKKTELLFINWLKDTGGANDRQARECYQCLSEWCRTFLI